MNRLTTNKKLDPEIFKNMKNMPENKYFLKVPDGKTFDGTIEMVADKLGKIEDIEEELGIDLITLFKALKDGIYVTNDEENIFHQNVLLHYDKDFFNKINFQLYATDGFNYYLKDYGKTWALTKEELENEL